MHCLNHLALLQHQPGILSCDHCPKVFKSVTALSIHTGLHFPQTAKCLYCCKTYSKESSLENHVRYDHSGLPFILRPNGKFLEAFELQAEDLVNNLLMSFSGPFKCTICRESHDTLEDLKKHVKIHSVRTVWECGFCGQAHSTENGIRDHVEHNHTG